MRIDGTRIGHVGEHGASERAHGAPTNHPHTGGGHHPPKADSDGASVVVSTAASAIAEASSRDQAARAERLATVKAELQAGTYKIDRDAIAQKLVDEELARRG